MFSNFLFLQYSGKRLSIREPHFCLLYPLWVAIKRGASINNCCCMVKSFFSFLYFSYNCSKLNASPKAILPFCIKSSGETAPWMRRISLPFRLMNTIVGKAVTLYFLVNTLFSPASTLTCTHTKLELKYLPTSCRVNILSAIILHGPHQSA